MSSGTRSARLSTGSAVRCRPLLEFESPPFHCMSLRRAVYSTLRECIVRMKTSSVRLKEKHHDHEEDEEKSKEELSIRALNELLRRYRVAVQLFLCDLISSVDECSQVQRGENQLIGFVHLRTM